jgi:creatinine amidohydrolase
MLLALDATRVRVDAAQPGATEPLPELMHALRTGGVRAVSPNGVLGDPTDASADEGRALLDTLVFDLVACVDGLES